MIENTIFDFSGESLWRGIEIIFLKPQTVLPETKVDKENIDENNMTAFDSIEVW